MLLMQANNIKKNYGTKTVLDFERLLVYEGEKLGIVGANGSGKTTLMSILYGDVPPDEGSVQRMCTPAYIRQFQNRDTQKSGGENAKAQIITQMSENDTVIFADEPTANLDADGQEWVLSVLDAAKTVLLVSHDRNLLDRICNRIVEIKDGKLSFYTGNYSDYEAAVALQRQQQQEDYETYQRKKSQLESAIQVKERNVSRQKTQHKVGLIKNSSEHRLRGDKRAAKMKKVEQAANALESRLEKLTPVEKLREPPKLRIDFSLTCPPGNKNVITGKGLSFAYGPNVIFDSASFIVPNGRKVAITGKNGSGKTTLLNLIYSGHEAITPVPKLRMGFLHQNFENLDNDKTVLDNVLSTSIQDTATVRSVLAGLLFPGDDVFKLAAVLSGGEKMRLSLAKLLTGSSNALLLDEPTNYLDLPSVQAVQRMIGEYPGTILLVCHDARFVQAVANSRLHIEHGKITPMPLAEEKPVTPADKTLLEIRLTRLVSEIGSAPPEQKNHLEQEYHRTLSALEELRRSS